MRNYIEEKKKSFPITLKLMLPVILPILIFFLILGLFSIIISKTAFPEHLESVVTIAASAIASITMSTLFTVFIKIKPIYCALITFLIILVFKFIMNLVLSAPIALGKQGITGIVFTLIFSIVGAILGANIKK